MLSNKEILSSPDKKVENLLHEVLSSELAKAKKKKDIKTVNITTELLNELEGLISSENTKYFVITSKERRQLVPPNLPQSLFIKNDMKRCSVKSRKTKTIADMKREWESKKKAMFEKFDIKNCFVKLDKTIKSGTYPCTTLYR